LPRCSKYHAMDGVRTEGRREVRPSGESESGEVDYCGDGSCCLDDRQSTRVV
jgi:hypothetical protein